MKKGNTYAQNKIKKDEFEKLCSLQCTYDEICSFFEVTDKTLTRWCKATYNMSFSEIFRDKRNIGKISLRRTQWKLAQKHYPMAIWLGKQYLGQRDKFDYEDEIEDIDAVRNEVFDNEDDTNT